MKQTNFQYPTFTNGGILSKEILDNLAGYGDEQARLTRARLIGCGIVNGLEYRFEKSDPCKLILSPGTAITADGNLICIDAETTYYLLKAKSPKNELETYVFSEEPKKKDFTAVKAIPMGYILALKYDRIPATQENCSQLTCDFVNVRTYVRCHPILHPRLMTDKSSYYPQVFPGHVEIERWHDIYSCLNTGVLHKHVRKLFNSGCTTLTNIVAQIAVWFSSDEGRAFACRFDDADARRNQLQNAYTRLQKLCFTSGEKSKCAEIPPYYLEFLEDMKDAVNEFIDAFNSLVSKYARIPTGAKIDDTTVALGFMSEGQPDLSHDMFRQFFEYVNRGDSFDQDCRIVWQLLRRFCTMVEQFSATSYQWKDKPLKIIPVNPTAPLSDRPIPFYYNTVGTDLRKVWKAQSIDNRMKDECYDSFTNQRLLNLDRSSSVYSVQGYYNQPKEDILSELKAQISLYCLPLKCREIKIEDISLSTNTIAILKNKLISPLENIAKNKEKVKSLESAIGEFIGSDVQKQILELSKSTANTGNSTPKKKMSVLEVIIIILAAAGQMALPLLRFIKNIDVLKQCLDSIRDGEIPDRTTIKKIDSLFAAQRDDFKLICNLYFDGLSTKNISEEKKDEYISSFMFYVALGLHDKSFQSNSLASKENDINEQLNIDYVKAFSELQKYISTIYREDFLYARDRYAEKNDTIYVAHHKGKVIYCFYD